MKQNWDFAGCVEKTLEWELLLFFFFYFDEGMSRSHIV